MVWSSYSSESSTIRKWGLARLPTLLRYLTLSATQHFIDLVIVSENIEQTIKARNIIGSTMSSRVTKKDEYENGLKLE